MFTNQLCLFTIYPRTFSLQCLVISMHYLIWHQQEISRNHAAKVCGYSESDWVVLKETFLLAHFSQEVLVTRWVPSIGNAEIFWGRNKLIPTLQQQKVCMIQVAVTDILDSGILRSSEISENDMSKLQGHKYKVKICVMLSCHSCTWMYSTWCISWSAYKKCKFICLQRTSQQTVHVNCIYT